jgi:hypothetical protein
MPLDDSCTLYSARRLVIECRHGVSRTSLRSFVGRVGFRDFDISAVGFFFVFAAIRGTLNPAIPHVAARFNAILICFVVAIVSGVLAAVCGRLTYKCIRAADRK